MTNPSDTSKRKAAEVTKPMASDSDLDKGMALAQDIMAEDRELLRKLSKL